MFWLWSWVSHMISIHRIAIWLHVQSDEVFFRLLYTQYTSCEPLTWLLYSKMCAYKCQCIYIVTHPINMLGPTCTSIWIIPPCPNNSTPETLNQLYVSFVRPHLEYATPVWDPHLQKDIDKLEKVQKFALRMCTKNWMASYDDLLTCCNIHPLSENQALLVFFVPVGHNDLMHCIPQSWGLTS